MLSPDHIKLLAIAELAAREAGKVRAHVEYQRRPFDWIVERLGVDAETLLWSLDEAYRSHTWDGTPDPMVVILTTLANWDNVGIESGTGTGKTFLAACITLWFLACHEDSIVVTVAPKDGPLKLQLWK